MGEYQTLLHTLALTMGVAWASGINLYAAVAVLGLAGNAGYVQLPDTLAIVEDPLVIIAACFMYCVEFFADKIPGIDSLWDVLHTLIRIPAGAALAAAVFGADHSSWAMAAALLGGTLAATSHVAKTTTRAAVNTSPEPFSNIAMSLLGDSVVPASLWLSWEHPYVFFAMLGVTLVVMVALIWVFGKFLRLLVRRVSERFSANRSTA